MFRIAVAGCGPAGLAAALLLHRAGHEVELFERFEAPRPIGSGLMLQPTGMAVLGAMGLSEEVLAAGARIERLFGEAAPSGRTVLDVRYSAMGPLGLFGLGIHRAELFACLHDAVREAGVPIHTGCAISGSELDAGKRTLLIERGATAGPFDLVVDALGSHSPLAPAAGRSLAYGALWTTLDWIDGAGFDWATLQQRYRRASRMIGVLPVGSPRDAGQRRLAFFWSIRADQYAHWKLAGLSAWKDEVRALWPACAPLLDQIADADQLVFARYAHRTLPRPIEPALIHIGDAWHSASPQLGQGANMALLDAWALARGLASEGALAQRLQTAIAMRRNHVRLYQWLTAALTPVYQSDSRFIPFVRDRLIGPVSKIRPANALQAHLVSGLIGRPLEGLGLARR